MRIIFNSLSYSASAALLMTTVFAAPVHAGFVGISRCNSAGDGSPPALHIVDGGQRYIIGVGESGLTRNAIFNEHDALAWAAASGLFPEGTTFGNYADFICGLQTEDVEVTPEPEPEPEPEEEAETIQETDYAE
jgi:hypothetical protein